MNKEQFLASLRERLDGLSQEDVSERLAFYSEVIDDRVEDGLTEEDAVAQLDSVDDIAERIRAEIPASRPVKEKRRANGLVILLLVLGSPVWISLLAAAFSVVVSVYAAVWSVMISLWAAELSLIVGAVAAFLAAGVFLFTGSCSVGLALLAAGLFCTGLMIFLFYGCLATTRGLWWLTKRFTLGIIGLFTRKDGK